MEEDDLFRLDSSTPSLKVMPLSADKLLEHPHTPQAYTVPKGGNHEIANPLCRR